MKAGFRKCSKSVSGYASQVSSTTHLVKKKTDDGRMICRTTEDCTIEEIPIGQIFQFMQDIKDNSMQ